MLLGERFYYGVCFVQVAVSLISVYYLYKAVLLALRATCEFSEKTNVRVAQIVCIFYGFNPNTFLWDFNILTESFALSASVFFVYAAIKYLTTMETKDGIFMILLSWVNTMIRPGGIGFSLAVLLLAVLLFILERKRISRRQMLSMGLALCLVFASYFAWMYGVFYYKVQWC